jgi:hypothetical protein
MLAREFFYATFHLLLIALWLIWAILMVKSVVFSRLESEL